MYVCMYTFSNIFSSETTRSIKANFSVEPPWDGEKKIYSNCPGHLLYPFRSSLVSISYLQIGCGPCGCAF